MMTVGSLFSGIGGFDLGLERAGMTVKWQVEIDPFCNKVLAKHWPHVKRYGDIRDVGKHNLEAVELICGGFPCQDISFAGRGRGLKGKRSGLWYEFARIIGEMVPRFVVVENVAGLYVRGMGEVLGTLASIGYDAEWTLLQANQFGIPQKRPRVFIVAYPASTCSQKILYQDPLNANRNQAGMDATRFQSTYFDNQNHRARPVSLLGNAQWPEIPNGERSGTDDGIPNRVDRLKSLGNAVVPQIVEVIGRSILEADKCPGPTAENRCKQAEKAGL